MVGKKSPIARRRAEEARKVAYLHKLAPPKTGPGSTRRKFLKGAVAGAAVVAVGAGVLHWGGGRKKAADLRIARERESAAKIAERKKKIVARIAEFKKANIRVVNQPLWVEISFIYGWNPLNSRAGARIELIEALSRKTKISPDVVMLMLEEYKGRGKTEDFSELDSTVKALEKKHRKIVGPIDLLRLEIAPMEDALKQSKTKLARLEAKRLKSPEDLRDIDVAKTSIKLWAGKIATPAAERAKLVAERASVGQAIGVINTLFFSDAFNYEDKKFAQQILAELRKTPATKNKIKAFVEQRRQGK